MKKWFALHTKPYSERKVAVRLEHNEIETFLPEIENNSKSSPTKRIPLFPGYLFMRLDLGATNPAHWRTLPGVRYIVSYGDEPVPVREELIRLIAQQLEALEMRKQQPNSQFERGDRVRIKNGPFRDMIAIFEGPTGPARRVHILLEIISRTRRLRVDASDLEKVSNRKQEAKGRPPRRTRGRGRPIRA